MQSLIRLFAAVATVVAVCFALVQLTGRALFWQLPRFEDGINVLLAPSGVAVEGLRGSWQGLNPSVFARRIWFPAGEMTGFDFELDLIESLTRNRVVARRMTVVDGHVAFEKTSDGWRLQGYRGAGFDAKALFVYSDQIWLRGRLIFRDDLHLATLHGEAMLANRDGLHRFDLHVQAEPDCGDCALAVAGDLTADGSGTVRVAAERFSLGSELHAVLVDGLAPDSPLRDMRFDFAVAADWRRDPNGDEQARLSLKAASLESPGSPSNLGAQIESWRDAGGDYRGRIGLALVGGQYAYRLDGGRFWLRDVNSSAPSADVWLPPVAIADLLAPVGAAIGTKHPAGNWLAKVAPRGDIEELVMRLDSDGLAVALRGTDGALSSHRGVPQVDNLAFVARGHESALQIEFDGRDFLFSLPDIFPAQDRHDHGGGTLLAAFSPDYVGLAATRLWAVRASTQAEFALGLARPNNRDEVRVAVEGKVDRVDWRTAGDYLPLRAPGLRRWLLGAVHAGEFHNVRLVYRGHARTRGDQPVRRLEMAANVLGGVVDYHPDWPAVSDVNGAIEIVADETRLHGTARAFDTDLAEVRLRVPHRLPRARVGLAGTTTVARLFDFVWATPLHDSLPFLSTAWHGTGHLDFAADIAVPFRQDDDGRVPGLRRDDVRLRLHFQDATLDFADLGLHFDAVDESVAYRFPATLSGDALQGTLFGHPVSVAIASDARAMRFEFSGRAAVEDTYRLLGMENLGVATGAFDFDAAFTVFPASERAMELEVASSLLGTAVTLPAPLGKTDAEARPMNVALRFLESHVAVSASYGDSSGWLHLDETGIRAGAVGIGTREATVDAEEKRVVLSGHLTAVDASDLALLIRDPAWRDSPASAWELRRFRIDLLRFESVEFGQLLLDGTAANGDIELEIESLVATAAAPQDEAKANSWAGPSVIAGKLAKSNTAPWQVDLSDLRLPGAESDDSDPLAPALMARVIPADVILRQVFVDGEDYGTWRFSMMPSADGVAFSDVVADIRGLRIESDGEVFWSKSNESRFSGSAQAADLKDVLPLWDFAPTVESESFQAVGQLRWPGSPLNFDLHHLSGTARLSLANGRFSDIEPGGTRILSLVNFSAIAKRMSLDFSDVFGEGVSFERVTADLTVDDGLARFERPAEITGTGSSFQLAGTVDLDSGALDNDMVVTLPFLNSNLPWYAAFLALSNPAGAAGVLLGRQVLKDQINRLSSGRYRIGGTYEAPEVEFVGIFDNNIDSPLAGDAVPDAPMLDGEASQ